MTDTSRPIACLGEAIVDLVAERRIGHGDDPGAFLAHPGGAPANVAAIIASAGVPAALIGGLGADRWGKWIRDRLEAEEVGTTWLVEVPEAPTPVAFVTFDRAGEPTFEVYGEGIARSMDASRSVIGDALERSCALVIGANTMVGETERAVTREAVAGARSLGLPVLFDPNHRPGRWDDQDTGAELALELVAKSDLVKANRPEAALLTGFDDPERAANVLLEMGPRLVVITDGPGRVIARGEAEAESTPEPVEVVSPLGAGDAFMGRLVADLYLADWDFSRAGEMLDDASAAAGECCRVWGART